MKLDPALFEGTIDLPLNGIEKDSTNEMELLRDRIKINLNNPITEPPTVLDILCNGEYRRFATAGNFSLVIGKAKSRKTFFISMIAASMVNGELFLEKFKPRLSESKRKIIIFDTEQGQYDVQQLNDRILRQAGMQDSENIEVYHLRALNTKQRVEFIEYVLYNTTGVVMAIVDGIRDLVYDINNAEEASQVCTKLLKWTAERDIHIVTVLHQNKADNNARGHLGAELTNKAESSLSIAKDQNNPEVSTVTPEYFRGKEFQPFAFKIDEDGLPYLTDEWISTQKTERTRAKKLDGAHQIPDEKHREILTGIFESLPTPKYADLINAIQIEFKKYGIEFGLNKAKEFKVYYDQKRWIRGETPSNGGVVRYHLQPV